MNDDKGLALKRGSDEWKGYRVDTCSLSPDIFVLDRAEMRKRARYRSICVVLDSGGCAWALLICL